MVEKIQYSGGLCSSGIVISFSGANLALEETYKVVFERINTLPSSTIVLLNPTGYTIVPSEKSPVFQTLFRSNSNISDNSSTNLISLSIYNNVNTLIYKDYKSIVCGNLCGSGFPVTPTPTITPTVTPTIAVTPTPTPSMQPVLNFRTAFDKLINNTPGCNQILVKGKAYGVINQRYAYSFGTDMTGVDLKISNPSGFITLLENPTDIYTTITLPDSCRSYSLEFGLSDGTDTVQSAAIFRCGNC